MWQHAVGMILAGPLSGDSNDDNSFEDTPLLDIHHRRPQAQSNFRTIESPPGCLIYFDRLANIFFQLVQGRSEFVCVSAGQRSTVSVHCPTPGKPAAWPSKRKEQVMQTGLLFVIQLLLHRCWRANQIHYSLTEGWGLLVDFWQNHTWQALERVRVHSKTFSSKSMNSMMGCCY